MAKFRKRVNTKGKRWKKGQSSSSNPSIQKYREAAQSRFFGPVEGESNLTQDALQKHNAFVGGEIEENNDVELESFGSKTYKTFDTFASDWSCVSNQSFSRYVQKFRSDSDMHKSMLAVLAAITEIIKEKGGTESSTEYFAALMTSLNSSENDNDSIAAILNLLSMCIKSTPQSVLQIKFADTSSILINLLAKYSQSEKVPIIRSLLGCLSVLLRAQEAAVWNVSSTLQILDSILTFIIFSKPKIRKAAQYGIAVIVKNSKITPNALGHIAKHCIRLVESVTTGGVTTTLHVLTLLKEIMHKFPKNEMKECCESVLKVMTMKNILLTSCGMQALHGMLENRPAPNCLPAHRNARLISALYNYQPPSDDIQPMQAWLVTMQQAYINLARTDISLCMANIVKLFRQLTELYHGQRPDIMTAVTYCLQAIMTECVAPAAHAKPKFNQPISEIACILEDLLTHKVGTALPHILHLLSAFFKECGEHCAELLTPCLKSVAELRDNTEFTYKSELENTVGSAIRTMGPQIVIDTVPFKITPGDRQFKRSWLLPVFKDNIKNATLKCFVDRFLPLAAVCRNEGDRLKKVNDQIGAVSYDLLQSQIWALLPSFSAHPTDISTSFGSLAKTLGGLLNSRKDLRLIILSTLRKLITHSLETDNKGDIATMGKYAKNYLPILFNIYMTKVTGSDEEGARLATLETIKVYLKISEKVLTKELFDRALEKVQNKESEEFIKENVMDLLKALLPYQQDQDIAKLYNEVIAKIKETDNHKEQKKYYRLLEEILIADSESCVQFLNANIDQINELVLGSLNKSATNSKGARLRCLFELLKRTENPISLLDTVLPEAILCVKDINNRCRETAFQILGHIAKNVDYKDYINILIAGLAGNPTMTSCSLLALAAIVYYIKDSLDPVIEEQLLYNVGLLAVCNTREIASTALSFIKVYLSTFSREKVFKYLPQLIKVLSNMAEDCKRHSRTKTRDILARLVRWFGGESLLKLVPNKDETLRTRIRNLAKIQIRHQKKRESDRQSKATTDISTFTIGNKQKSIEEILNESDSDLPLDDDEVEENERPKKKNKQKTWIAENADEIVDFTDIRASHKITGTKPGSNLAIPTLKKAKPKSDFKTAPDGRLIIMDDKAQDMEEDDDDDDIDFSNRKKKKKKQVIPGFEDSDDDYEPSDDDVLTKTTAAGLGLKRALSVSTLNSSTNTNKYRAGGTGIHRPIKKAVNKKEKRKKGGAEYKAIKAKGDIKRKGKPDPYAYLPLRRDALNKRKRMKNMAQVKNILKAAKTGANIGRKFKMKKK
uniref:NUC173 domain-containing protein n=1 Tax=Rhodnius prolixus TaxID=13249 RepID=T1I3K1_RHOPR